MGAKLVHRFLGRPLPVYGKVLPGNPKMIPVEGAEKGAETARHHFSVDRTLALPAYGQGARKKPSCSGAWAPRHYSIHFQEVASLAWNRQR